MAVPSPMSDRDIIAGIGRTLAEAPSVAAEFLGGLSPYDRALLTRLLGIWRPIETLEEAEGDVVLHTPHDWRDGSTRYYAKIEQVSGEIRWAGHGSLYSASQVIEMHPRWLWAPAPWAKQGK